MRELIAPNLTKIKTLADINLVMRRVLKELKQLDPEGRIGYVSGIITAKGRDKSPVYLVRLAKYTEYVRKSQHFSVFSATDIFDKQIFDQINAHQLSGEDFKVFWQEMFKFGFITDIFMTPKWDIPNSGSEDEHKTAKRLGIRIHYIAPVEDIEQIVR